MDEIKKNKVEKFMADKTMSDAVYGILLNYFLSPDRQTDIHYLAASRIAIDFLQEGWKELEKFKTAQNEKTQATGNVGL